MTNPLEVVEAQAAVIAAQANTIAELYSLLLQHVAADEIDRLPCMVDLARAEARLEKDTPSGR